jgi:fumarylacetoacetate (FAA) hydrolase family protein
MTPSSNEANVKRWIGDVNRTLPVDGVSGALVGRAWLPAVEGPAVVAIRSEGVVDVSAEFPTVRDLVESDDPAGRLRSARGPVIGTLAELLANTIPDERDPACPSLLSPIDLQVVKAAGVTFAVSMIERVIEERARGDAAQAATVRKLIVDEVGMDLRGIRPGSEEATRLKRVLEGRGLWSQYLEVGIGPDAEIFTKAPVLATVGTAMDVGVLASSKWNNPEPEVVLVITSNGVIAGAALGNDVNLRDVEGRSALLLPKAKDNNASASIGPFIRLFDDDFTLDDVKNTTVTLDVSGEDGFELTATSPLSEISRDPSDLVEQLMGAHHQYPDGAVLYLGTMFAPVADRAEPAMGFTHARGDIVSVSAPLLGALVNRVQTSEEAAPWEFGIGAFMRNLASRGLL